MQALRIATIDDHPLVLEGLGHILRMAGHEVLKAPPAGAQTLTWIQAHDLDAVTVDIGMPGLNGIELARQVQALCPRVAIIVVTQQTDKAYLRAAIQAGALGFVSKQSAGTELLTALTAVSKGRLYISPAVFENSPDSRALLKKVLHNQNDILTARQQVVLQHISEGKTMKEIALAMKISVKTVEFHKRALTELLGISTTAELTKYAIAHGHAFLPDRA